MHADRNQESSDPRPESERRNVPTNEREDAAIQSAVLALLLDQHPSQLTLAELAREVAEDPGDFTQRDAIARAVGDLVGAGLLHRHGDFAIPTRAAVHFDRLGGRVMAGADIAAIFGDNLTRARRAADISQDELGRLCDVHRTEISQLERGLRIPRLDTFAKICSSLEVEPAELMTGIVWRPPRINHGSFEAPGAKDG